MSRPPLQGGTQRTEASAILRFTCSGCGVEDRSVWNKVGVAHWRRGRDGEDFEVVCGSWSIVRPQSTVTPQDEGRCERKGD